MTSPGFDVMFTLRTGPTEQDVVIRQSLIVQPEGTSFRIPLAPVGAPHFHGAPLPVVEIELYPRTLFQPAAELDDEPLPAAPAVPDHEHHPLSNPDVKHIFAVCYVDPHGLLTMTPWTTLDAAEQIAKERRGCVVAFPIVVDHTRGPSLYAGGSWPMAKQTEGEISRTRGHLDRDPSQPFSFFPPGNAGEVVQAVDYEDVRG